MIELQTALRIAGAVFFLIAVILGVFRPNLFELSPLKRAIRAYLVVLAAMGIAMLLGIVQTPNKAKSVRVANRCRGGLQLPAIIKSPQS